MHRSLERVMTISVLMVAEKPSICTAIATALSSGSMETHGRSPPVHEFYGQFRGESAFFRVTSVTGHVFSLDFASQYQQWDSVDPIDLFDAPVVSSPEGKGGIVRHLEREARGMDVLVLWLDCDREGENICFEVIRCVAKHMNNNVSNGRTIFRARFSAVTLKDIEKALQNLSVPNEAESQAVEARQELDLKVGVAFSRFQTRYFQGKYGDLDSSVISYGPCQTPTLGFCVNRHDEIQSFSSEQYWSIEATIDVTPLSECANRQLQSPLSLKWSRGRIFDESVAQLFLDLIRGNSSNNHPKVSTSQLSQQVSVTMKCVCVRQVQSVQCRPLPLNTVELLKLASKVLHIGPQATMHAAEQLYLRGYITYPRTESRAYPASFSISDTLQELRGHHEYGSCVTALLRGEGMMAARKGVDAGDHPPISPCGLARDLSGEHARIYDLIVRQFLASISCDAVFVTTTARFEAPTTCLLHTSTDCGGVAAQDTSAADVGAVSDGEQQGEEFSISSKQLITPGFLDIIHYHKLVSSGRDVSDVSDVSGGGGGGAKAEDDCAGVIPETIREGCTYKVHTLKLTSGQTTAPGFLSESELIEQMEKHHIGTDASISTHINNILVRNYVTLGQGRTLVPTTLGTVLVHGYYRIDPDLVLPDIRATIEKHCDLIAEGKATKNLVIENSLKIFKQKFAYFTSHMSAMDSLFEASFSPLTQTGKYLSKCGQCLRYMRYIPMRPQRLHCPSCAVTYNLPQNGTIKLYKELRCPLDNFELVFFSLGNTSDALGKSYPLCPYCYNFPPDFASGVEVAISANSSSASSSSSTSASAAGVVVTEAGAHGGGCNSCQHPTCMHSARRNALCPCPGSHAKGEGGLGDTHTPCSGMLVLNTNSKPNWSLACNTCDNMLRIHGDIHNITPAALCEKCGRTKAAVEFNKLKSPLPDGQTKYTGCLVCDDQLTDRTELVKGRTINRQIVRQMKHRQQQVHRQR